MEVKTACKYLDDYKVELVLTTDPIMIDKIVCHTDRIPLKVIRILHVGDRGTWTSQEPTQDHLQGYTCNHCHEPVMAYLALMESKQVRHARQMCGCTMIMMDATSLPWWSEINSREMWDAIVEGAKQAHRQGGVI